MTELATVRRRAVPQMAVPVLAPDDWNWQLRGRCLSVPAEVFFPEDEGRRIRRQREEQAKRICLSCPVLATCREHALRTPERYGVWGATTARERASHR